MSTDVRKAFDTVSLPAFTHSLQILGFDDGVVKILNNLQSSFRCKVRTPFGMTQDFAVSRGCKQGCSLSPLRFILVYDIFLKYLEYSNIGYKWKLTEELTNSEDNTLNIPGCAIVDDMLIFGSDRDEFVESVTDFDNFLQIVGLSLNPSKCHYTSLNDPDYPHIQIRDHNRNFTEVPHKHSTKPIKYLGYLISVHDWETNIKEVWRLHNLEMIQKFRKAHAKISTSRLRMGEIAHMVNSDAQSVLRYFYYAV